MSVSSAPRRFAVRAASIAVLPATVDDDPAPEPRRLSGGDIVQQRDGVEHARGVARRNIDVLAERRHQWQ